MNYIKELNAFERWLETNYLPATSQLLWYKLVALFNRCGWAEWITVDNQRLMVLIQCKSEKTFIRARDNLIEKGLFVYRKGKKGSPNAYRMVSFETINPVNNTVNLPVFMTVETPVDPPVETTDIIKQIKDQTILHKDKKKNHNMVDGQNNRTQDEQSVDLPLVGQVVDYLNHSCQTEFKAATVATSRLISARAQEGFGFDDFRAVIDTKSAEWRSDPRMNQYLRPQTLFGTKFEGYLNQSRKLLPSETALPNGYNYAGKGERSL
ncbi:conserved phage C-terminal domain-containing protein [uncultured Acetobacterium sp.]|uniref:conserved phage C-terminal domain-containing protein n=1 Tax=uncultured Acetobacterium sp. TaxID=217139 RepID=UPI0025EB876A|nr:conserved phage C-terminal domain-containing protein [uncultured Acetobacterium sp.]